MVDSYQLTFTRWTLLYRIRDLKKVDKLCINDTFKYQLYTSGMYHTWQQFNSDEFKLKVLENTNFQNQFHLNGSLRR